MVVAVFAAFADGVVAAVAAAAAPPFLVSPRRSLERRPSVATAWNNQVLRSGEETALAFCGLSLGGGTFSLGPQQQQQQQQLHQHHIYRYILSRTHKDCCCEANRQCHESRAAEARSRRRRRSHFLLAENAQGGPPSEHVGTAFGVCIEDTGQ